MSENSINILLTIIIFALYSIGVVRHVLKFIRERRIKIIDILFLILQAAVVVLLLSYIWKFR